MDRSQFHRRENPKQTSNIFSKIFFLYTLPLFKKGLKKELEVEDLYDVLPEYDSHTLGQKIEKEWQKQKHRKNCAIFVVFWNLLGKYYVLLGFTKLTSIFLFILRPIIVGKLVSFFLPGQIEISKTEVYFFSLLLVVINFADTIYRQNYYLQAESLAIKLRTAICGLIYRHLLKLPITKLKEAPFGKIENLLTRDVAAFEFGLSIFNDSWTGFIAIFIICYNMYWRIGQAIVVVVVVFSIFFLFAIYAGIKMVVLKRATSEKTDDRINIIQTVLLNIKTSKMYAWEKYLETAIIKARKREMNILLKLFVVLFFIIVLSVLIQDLSLYLVLLTCFWLGTPVTAETIYFLTSAFQSMNFPLTTAIPYGTFVAAQVFAALKRFQNLAEKLEAEDELTIEAQQVDAPKIIMENASVNMRNKNILKNVNIIIGSGLTLVYGPVTSGKSVLLLTLLKEFQLTEGRLNIVGKISYASEKPWFFPGTIKQNIVFGAEFDAKRYQEVIDMCDLQQDLDMLENGDNTVMFDQGINLSRGQQSRTNLARAIYRDSDIYLLDDCLSNLDPIVADKIFRNCILNFLKDKIVILVTNNMNLTKFAHRIVRLNNGNVKCTRCQPSLLKEKPLEENDCLTNITSYVTNDDRDVSKAYTVTSNLLDQETKNEIYGEIKKKGCVSKQIYKYYVILGGGKIFCLGMFVLFLLAQISASYKDILLSDWANLKEQILNSNLSSSSVDKQEFDNIRDNGILNLYTIVVAAMCLLILFRVLSLFIFSKNLSIHLHKKMLHSVIYATMSFFDNNFIGNIVNRFSKDLVHIDEGIPFTLLHLVVIIFKCIGVIFLICLVNGLFLIPTAFLIISLSILRKIYLKTGRALKRLDASTKSPIVGDLNAVINGLPTIRAFQAEKMLIKEFDKHQNVYISASYSSLCCMKTFIFAVDCFTSMFTAIVVLKFVFFDQDASPGDVGLAISQAFMMGGILYYGFYKWADLETQMTSVERVVEYIQISHELQTGLVLKDWPARGELEYKNVDLCFKNCKAYVLKNINLKINAGEKIGIVGRTGSGKSSLMSILFRLYEIEGTIIIDGKDIKTLSLEFLRSKLSIIPQEPLLLDGTLRHNIDPESKCKDEDIWKAIDAVKLRHLFSSLDVEIQSSDFTFGQKQLLNLAKILIQKNRIILFDEITDNDDSVTEHLIDEIISRYFASCTVIKITHRMKFVMDCDKILVLSNGEIVEFDHPQILLKKKGLFYQMVKVSLGD